MKKLLQANFKFLVVVLLSSLGLIGLTYLSLPDNQLHLHFFDIGQGDSIMVQTPSKYNILIDGGPGRKVTTEVGKVLPFWDKKIDLLVATNPDKDHINGLNFILEGYQVDRIWLPRVANSTESYQNLLANIKKYQVKSEAPRTGDTIKLSDGTEIQVLWPKTKEPQVPTINEGSIVLVIRYQNFQVLMTGDAESTTQPYSGLEEEIEILKVPHHGSKAGMQKDYLKMISPELAVISAGKNNSYGHPDPTTVSELKEVGSEVLTTIDKGTIEVVTDGKTWYSKTER